MPGERALTMRITRRWFVAGAAGVAVVGGCGVVPKLDDGLYEVLDPDLPPLAEEEDNMQKHYDPLVLFASCDCPPAPGEISPNVLSLKEPHNLPMEILEIRFRVYPLNGGPNNTTLRTFQTVTGQGIGVKLDLGNIPVVNSGVPINCFSTARDSADQSAEVGIPNGNAVLDLVYTQEQAVSTDASSGQSALPRTYFWRLKYPLFIPPGAVLAPTFTALGQNHFPVRIEISYHARTREAGYHPKNGVMVPWVTSFSSKAFDNVENTVAGSDASIETDLVNPFSVPLEISRLVGVQALIVNGFGDAGNAGEDNTDHRFRLSTTQIRSSRGDDIARTPLHFNGLFPFSWRAWDIPGGWQLAPGEFYQLNLGVGPVEYPTTNGQIGRAQYSVGMIGYRSIDGAALKGGG